MKAICIKKFDNIKEGSIIDYNIDFAKRFVVNGLVFGSAAAFFEYFKVAEHDNSIGYKDFEYILFNYIFPDALFMPSEYAGARNLIIQFVFGYVIMITINKEENVIRVSFDDCQKKYSSYEMALEGINNKKKER